MHARALLLTSATLFAAGCVTNVDSTARFEIHGLVTDGHGSPVPSVDLYFVDVGVSPNPTQRETEFIARTDDTGQISTTYEYSWGYSYRLRRPHTSSAFDLALKKNGRVLKLLHFLLSDLPSQRPPAELEAWECVNRSKRVGSGAA